MAVPSGSQAVKKAVSIQMDEIGCLEINITVTGKEVVLKKDEVPPQKIEYKNNLQIIIRDPKAGHKAAPKAGTSAAPKAGTKAGHKTDRKTDHKTDQKGHDKN